MPQLRRRAHQSVSLTRASKSTARQTLRIVYSNNNKNMQSSKHICLQLFAILALALSSCLAITIQPRSSWGAVAARSPSRISGKVDYVIIHHSDNPNGCSTQQSCQRLIKNIQSDHKTRRKFSDIGYNFIIAGDGNIYEGRGFGLQGSHAPNYNRNSIGIVFIGNFDNVTPSPQMLQNAKDLMAHAVQSGYLKDNYTLLGHRQTKATACPGNKLYEEIKTWPHWRNI